MFSFVVGIGQPSWGWRRGWARVTRYQKWLKPEIPATQEAETGGLRLEASTDKKFRETLFQQEVRCGGTCL
jgi:hypothetical protein